MKAIVRNPFLLAAGLTVGILAAGCSGNPLPEAGSADEQLFRNKCTACHSWPHPQRHTAVEWDHYLKVMEGHMKKKNIAFTETEKETIRNYLHRNAR